MYPLRYALGDSHRVAATLEGPAYFSGWLAYPEDAWLVLEHATDL
jgi:CBS domain containing-hemolysin-like protein